MCVCLCLHKRQPVLVWSTAKQVGAGGLEAEGISPETLFTHCHVGILKLIVLMGEDRLEGGEDSLPSLSTV